MTRSAAPADPPPPQDAVLTQAIAFASPLLAGRELTTGEDMLAHAHAVAAILRELGHDSRTQLASYLVYASRFLQKPQEVMAQAFGQEDARLAVQTHALIRIQQSAAGGATQKETVRKMLLAFARDVRAVVLRLASRLQTMRYCAVACPVRSSALLQLADESLQVFAPLAHRLGIGSMKWELEDLAFRLLEPLTYKEIAHKLEVRRSEREHRVQSLMQQLQLGLRQLGLEAEVQGRPKHIYSIVKKMRGKHLAFHQVMDICALRCIVGSSDACYQTLAWLHTHFAPIDGEFDDYIAKPKSNGYQSLHTVVRDSYAQPVEVQIRSRAMHEYAEHGVAAHWAYKEAGSKGYGGVSANSEYDRKIATLRQLLAWERDMTTAAHQPMGLFADHIYVLTPQAAVIELPEGATPIDFAYAVHTDMGHRCRGAKVDGQLVPLNTPLQNGQTVEVIVAKPSPSAESIGPSRDWLNADLHYLVSARARVKVRAWFNAQHVQQVIARGREQVEKILQREGRTAVSLDELANRLASPNAQHLFELVGREELPLRHIQEALQTGTGTLAAANPPPGTGAWLATAGFGAGKNASKEGMSGQSGSGRAGAARPSAASGVLIQGLKDVLLQLAPCCRPMPPDAIAGYVTRGKGVSVHRQNCPNFLHLAHREGARVLQASWDEAASAHTSAARYAVAVQVLARERNTLLRDISEVLARHKVPVQSIHSKNETGGVQLRLVLQVPNGPYLHTVLQQLQKIKGVTRAARQGQRDSRA